MTANRHRLRWRTWTIVGVIALLVLSVCASWVIPPLQQGCLLSACISGDVERVRLLLLSGADANARYEGGLTPLMYTSGSSNPFLQVLPSLRSSRASPILRLTCMRTIPR